MAAGVDVHSPTKVRPRASSFCSSPGSELMPPSPSSGTLSCQVLEGTCYLGGHRELLKCGNKLFRAASELQRNTVPAQLCLTQPPSGCELVLGVLRYSQVLSVLNNLSRVFFANIVIFFCRPTKPEIRATKLKLQEQVGEKEIPSLSLPLTHCLYQSFFQDDFHYFRGKGQEVGP